MRYLGLILFLVTGCGTAKVAQPLTAELASSDPAAQLEFWHTLNDRPITSNDEAFHGLLLFFDGQDPAESYEQRVQVLKSRRMLPQDFDQPADQAVQRGTLAVALTRGLNIEGGLMSRLTGNHPRYATREMVYHDLYPPSSPQQTFSGAEFLGVIGRAEDYQLGDPSNLPAENLPGEVDAPASGDPTDQS